MNERRSMIRGAHAASVQLPGASRQHVREAPPSRTAISEKSSFRLAAETSTLAACAPQICHHV